MLRDLGTNGGISMRCLQSLTIVCATVAMAVVASPASAAFHLWKIDEVFSNSDGSVQFIELVDGSDFEQSVSGHALTSTVPHSVTPSTNLPAVNNMTAGHHMLFATAGFGSLSGGVTPDYTIPANFFKTTGDTLNWAGFDSKTFGAVPTDGINSFTLPGSTTGANSPTNFAGATGSVNLAPPPTPTGDYNGDHIVDAADYTVWRDTLGQSVSVAGNGADGDKSGVIDSGDYDFWKSKFGTALPGAGSGAAAPEPATLPLLVVGLVLVALARYAH
jgi:hypothetical protein